MRHELDIRRLIARHPEYNNASSRAGVAIMPMRSEPLGWPIADSSARIPGERSRATSPEHPTSGVINRLLWACCSDDAKGTPMLDPRPASLYGGQLRAPLTGSQARVHKHCGDLMWHKHQQVSRVERRGSVEGAHRRHNRSHRSIPSICAHAGMPKIWLRRALQLSPHRAPRKQGL